MDLSLWRMGRDIDVPAGKPLIMNQQMYISVPSVHQDAPRVTLPITGDAVGELQKIRGGDCLYFTGEVEYEAASPAAFMGAQRQFGQVSSGCIVIGERGPFAVGKLAISFGDHYYFGVNPEGELLLNNDLEDVRFFGLAEWNLVAYSKAGARIVLAGVSAKLRE
ncbi:hypothetical protein [uncultured Stenotrophomonas sp.]|uniref:hypothetical protein n=1 Tax=uncultured Stenotrophomonas sp. TaxID=165438 RepID=UPI0025D421AA|nr:hypothetical protein [uncultured Stenotrophomonas sp.]